MLWSSGRLTLNITKKDARCGSHPGPCDDDIAYLMTLPRIRRQLNKLDKDDVVGFLGEYGAWTMEEMENHEKNLSRVLWIACGNITGEIKTRQNIMWLSIRGGSTC